MVLFKGDWYSVPLGLLRAEAAGKASDCTYFIWCRPIGLSIPRSEERLRTIQEKLKLNED